MRSICHISSMPSAASDAPSGQARADALATAANCCVSVGQVRMATSSDGSSSKAAARRAEAAAAPSAAGGDWKQRPRIVASDAGSGGAADAAPSPPKHVLYRGLGMVPFRLLVRFKVFQLAAVAALAIPISTFLSEVRHQAAPIVSTRHT